MHPDTGVTCARTTCHQTDTRTPGEFARGICHKRSAAFLPARDEAQIVGTFMNRVEYGQEAFPRHPEHRIGALRDQPVCQNFAASSVRQSRCPGLKHHKFTQFPRNRLQFLKYRPLVSAVSQWRNEALPCRQRTPAKPTWQTKPRFHCLKTVEQPSDGIGIRFPRSRLHHGFLRKRRAAAPNRNTIHFS